MSKRVLACLWEGKVGYGQRDVDNLKRACDDRGYDLLVLTDGKVPLTGVEMKLFQGFGVGGWSARMEAFRPDLRTPGRQVLLDLDTVLVGDCDWLFEWNESPVGLPLDPYYAPIPCSGVVTFSTEGAEIAWGAFMASREDGMRRHKYMSKPSEMALLRALYAEQQWTPLEHTPRKILSYKVHVKNGKNWDESSIIMFHGRPRPWQVTGEVNDIWNGK